MRDGADWIEDSSYFQKWKPLSLIELDQLLRRLDIRQSATPSEESPVAEYSEYHVQLPTYVGALKAANDDDSGGDFGEPALPVLITVGDSIRVVLGTHDLESQDEPDVFIERRPRGWALFIHPDGGDPCAFIYILDDGQTYCVRDTLIPSPMQLVDECPASVDCD